MLIRCEKCNTLYELDDKLLPPNGAPVQCSKCQFVFKAYPGSGGEPAASGAGAGARGGEGTGPATSVAPSNQPSDRGATDAHAGGAGVLHDIAAGGGAASPDSTGAAGQPNQASSAGGSDMAAPEEPQFTADGRPIRKVPFPTEEPAAAGPRPVLGRVPDRPSGSPGARRRWALLVVPLAFALVLAAIIIWLMLGRRPGSAAPPQRAEGHSLLLPQQGASFGRARVASSVTRTWIRDRAPSV